MINEHETNVKIILLFTGCYCIISMSFILCIMYYVLCIISMSSCFIHTNDIDHKWPRNVILHLYIVQQL